MFRYENERWHNLSTNSYEKTKKLAYKNSHFNSVKCANKNQRNLNEK